MPLHANVDFDAHLEAALFLGMIGGWLLLLVVWALARWKRMPRLASGALGLGVVGTCVYFGLLVGFARFSKEKTLGRGVEKYFCELDCHIAYSVQGVESKKVFAAAGAAPVTQEWDVTLQTRFDETTTAPWRPNDVPLTPGPREVEAVTDDGRVFIPIVQGTSLASPLKPGESYRTNLVFQLPVSAKRPRLLVAAGGWPSPILIGSENSPGHKQTYFSLE